MMSISKGIIIMESSREKRISRPGNFSLEKAKAARMVENCVQATHTTVTITELRK